MPLYQVNKFIIAVFVFMAIGSVISVLFYEIDILIGFSVGLLILMGVIMMLVKYVIKYTDKSLSNQEDIE